MRGRISRKGIGNWKMGQLYKPRKLNQLRKKIKWPKSPMWKWPLTVASASSLQFIKFSLILTRRWNQEKVHFKIFRFHLRQSFRKMTKWYRRSRKTYISKMKLLTILKKELMKFLHIIRQFIQSKFLHLHLKKI